MPTHIRAALVACSLLVSGSAHAHIKMLKPAPWVTTNNLGDPQKMAPCGTGAGATGTPTNEITTFKAGETITVEWKETVDHPGHFRIALAKNRDDLEDPELMPDGQCNYPDGAVPTGPHGNVLLDNLFPTKDTGGTRDYSQQVTLPNEPCEKCTLQLIQWMTKHPPSCIYYQCADIKIVAADGAAGSSGAPAAGGGGSGTGSAGTAAAGAGTGGAGATAAAGSGGDRAGSASPPAGGSGGTNAGSPSTAAGTTSSPPSAGTAAAPPASHDDDGGGCGVANPGAPRSGPSWQLLLLGALGWWRRRRRR